MKRSEQGSFLQDVQRQFSYVFDGDDTVEESDSDDFVVIEGDCIRLRFIRDRTDFFLDVGSPDEPDTWYSSYDVLDVVTDKLPLFKRPVAKNRPGPVSKLLKSYYEELKLALRERRHQLQKT